MGLIAGIVSAVVGAAASAGLSAANAPKYPNAAASSKRVSNATLRALPGQLMADRAARLGTEVDIPTGKNLMLRPAAAYRQGFISRDEYQRLRRKEQQGDRDIWGGNLTDVALPGVYTPGSSAAGIAMRNGKIFLNVGPKTQHADFRGYGDADVQSRLADQMARNQLDLQEKYGDQFLAEAKAQQEAADPEGTKARALLASEVNRMEDDRQGKAHPVADQLDAQMLQELQKGKGTTSDVDAAVADVLARRADQGTGGNLDAGGVNTELTTGPRGDARLQQRLQHAMSYLSSGATPEDVDYRRRQQSMSNMGNFLSGKTPEAQFQTLAGGQQGPAPSARGPGLVGLPQNAQQQANQASVNSINLGAQNNQSNINPWFAGVSTLLRGLNTAGAAGWQPFSSNPSGPH